VDRAVVVAVGVVVVGLGPAEGEGLHCMVVQPVCGAVLSAAPTELDPGRRAEHRK